MSEPKWAWWCDRCEAMESAPSEQLAKQASDKHMKEVHGE